MATEEMTVDPTMNVAEPTHTADLDEAAAAAAAAIVPTAPMLSGSENRWAKNGYGQPTAASSSGKFSKEETEIVRSAIKEYCAMKKITPARLCSECDHKAELKGAWMEIARRLPHRTVQSVYRHGLRQLHPFKRGPWAEEEVNQLMDLVNRYGKKWSAIQSKLNRTADSCRDKHREMSSDFVKGRWKDNETECLKRLIREHLRADPNADIVELAKMVERENIVMPWSTISKRMGKRSRLSCFKKWQKMTGLGDDNKKVGFGGGESKGSAANGVETPGAADPVPAAVRAKRGIRQAGQLHPPPASAAEVVQGGAISLAVAAATAAAATATTGLTPNPIATAAAVEAGAEGVKDEVDEAAVDATSAAQIAAETVEAVDLPVIQTSAAGGSVEV